MKVWQFTEQPYPDAWDADPHNLRVTLPNRHFDPVKGAELLNRYLDEWMLCDDLGLNIMINEHHSTSTCLSASCTMPLAMLARQTHKARLLTLGIPLCNRNDPVRIAEELSYIDVVSRGRLEMGFVKGVPHEIAPANSNPVRMMDRFWESLDLIEKAMTEHDGAFNWEGEYFHYRQVNIWPRPYQQPRPNIWISAGSPASIIKPAERGYTIATVMSGLYAKFLFHTYRKRVAEMGRPEPAANRFAYLALVGVGQTRAEGYARLDQIRGYLRTTPIVAPQFHNPPGYAAPQAVAQALSKAAKGRVGAEYLRIVTRDGRTIDQTSAPHEDLIQSGTVFAGTPDDVYEQIKRFNADVGGLGHLLIMAHGGSLSPEDTRDNLTLFSREVLPRLQDLTVPQREDFEELEKIREEARKSGQAAQAFGRSAHYGR